MDEKRSPLRCGSIGTSGARAVCVDALLRRRGLGIVGRRLRAAGLPCPELCHAVPYRALKRGLNHPQNLWGTLENSFGAVNSHHHDAQDLPESKQKKTTKVPWPRIAATAARIS